ncbi:carbohydrate binding domain-containing protein [Herpetosiphon sp. NSE202]|uniref:carbohydrate binding domain-containing protein n=1 Tax=Herpetosiphon sp. NSE202 TaxID=3351349 RepID=UPI003630FF0F
MHAGARTLSFLGLLALMFNLVGLNFDQRQFQAQLNSTNITTQLGLINPSFENSTQGWLTNGPCNITTNAGSAIHGNWYLVANRNNTEACSSSYQDLAYPLQANFAYRLAVWVRSPNGTPLYGTLALWGIGPTSNQNKHTHFTTVGSDWQCVETIFVPTNTSASLRTEFYLRSNNGDYHFDDVQLSDQTNPLCPSIPLQNPSFKQGTFGWSHFGPCYIGTSSGSAYEGNHYLVANRNGTETCSSIYQDQTYPVKANRTYRLAMWVRSSNGNPLNGTLTLWGLNDFPHDNSSTNFTTSGIGWQCVETVLRPTYNHPKFRAEFYLKSMGGDYHFDYVQLSEQATPLCPNIPLRNPSIEQATDGWLPSGPCYMNRGINAAFEGTGYLVANRNGSLNCSSVIQDIQVDNYPVKANRTYRLATWIRSPNGIALNGTIKLWGQGNWPDENGSANFTTSGTGWQCVEAVLQSTNDHPKFRVEFALQALNSDYHFDAVAVREQATPICP